MDDSVPVFDFLDKLEDLTHTDFLHGDHQLEVGLVVFNDKHFREQGKKLPDKAVLLGCSFEITLAVKKVSLAFSVNFVFNKFNLGFLMATKLSVPTGIVARLLIEA